VFIGLIVWCLARKKVIPKEGAWNTVGRLWREIGIAILVAVGVLYLLAGWRPFSFGFVAVSGLSNAIEKSSSIRAILDVIASATYYSWVCALLPTLLWVLVATFLFVKPGGRIAREKLNFK
jgi:hypothetical protein